MNVTLYFFHSSDLIIYDSMPKLRDFSYDTVCHILLKTRFKSGLK